MTKNFKIGLIAITATILLASDYALIVSGTKGQTLNSWWAGGLAVLSIVYGVMGLMMAKRWSWLKSKIGQSVFFIALGAIMWGVGQAGWTYYAFKYPTQEYQSAKILDILFFSSIPLWFYGALKLTKATGAKFGLKTLKGKMLVIGLTIIMAVLSYYLLVVVARGGWASYSEQSLWAQFFGLGYSIGDAIVFTVALAIFGLSWKYLGGRFKYPILTILSGFGVMFIADTVFNYRVLKDSYYNGDISDVLYFIAIATLTIALCLLDPTNRKASKPLAQPPVSDMVIGND